MRGGQKIGVELEREDHEDWTETKAIIRKAWLEEMAKVVLTAE